MRIARTAHPAWGGGDSIGKRFLMDGVRQKISLALVGLARGGDDRPPPDRG
jgi:hypothetical protein